MTIPPFEMWEKEKKQEFYGPLPEDLESFKFNFEKPDYVVLSRDHYNKLMEILDYVKLKEDLILGIAVIKGEDLKKCHGSCYITRHFSR